MNDDLNPESLASRVPMARWNSVTDSDGSFAILSFDEGRKALVLTASGRWAWTSRDRTDTIRLHELQLPEGVGALPLLEIDPMGLDRKLAEAAHLLSTSPDALARALPLESLFDTAFGTRSDYWINRALSWMEKIPTSPIPTLAMRTVLDDATVGQAVRHRTRRLLSQRGSR